MTRCRERGFSLVEVLVALIVTAIGLLGLAKLQAVVYASTGNASQRSLAAIEAASMVSAMRANRLYWSALPAALTVSVGNVAPLVTASGDAALSTALVNTAPATPLALSTYCQYGGAGAPCTASSTMAAYDLNVWASSLNSLLPGANGTITCSALVTSTPSTPAACTIVISWLERSVAANTQSQGITLAAPTYTLYVVP